MGSSLLLRRPITWGKRTAAHLSRSVANFVAHLFHHQTFCGRTKQPKKKITTDTRIAQHTLPTFLALLPSYQLVPIAEILSASNLEPSKPRWARDVGSNDMTVTASQETRHHPDPDPGSKQLPPSSKQSPPASIRSSSRRRRSLPSCHPTRSPRRTASSD